MSDTHHPHENTLPGPSATTSEVKPPAAVRVIEMIIFQSRWILAPLYLGLIVGMILYSLKFMVELVELFKHFKDLSESEMMVGVLGLLDVTMVGNLIQMVLIGGWSSFVRKIEFGKMNDRPQGFSKLNSGMLKVKMGMSLIGVSSIHLLKIFTQIVGNLTGEGHHTPFVWPPIIVALTIHVIFVVSTIGMALTDKVMHAADHDHQENS